MKRGTLNKSLKNLRPHYSAMKTLHSNPVVNLIVNTIKHENISPDDMMYILEATRLKYSVAVELTPKANDRKKDSIMLMLNDVLDKVGKL